MNYPQALLQYTHIGTVTECVPFGGGHINDTFSVRTENGRYVLQRINSNVFKKPLQVMHNLLAVTEHIRKKAVIRGLDPRRATLTVIPTDGGECCAETEGDIWRLCLFIDNSVARDRIEGPEDMYACAKAFGVFQRSLADLPADGLWHTIPDFHNTPKRLTALEEAVRRNAAGRAASVGEEIEFALARRALAEKLEKAHAEGLLPLRITHNDTKLNNVLFDAASGAVLAVIDLDTVMPGYSVNDLGDLVRYGASTAAEDERDLSKVALDMELYRAAVDGFVCGCGNALTAAERELLPYGAMLMTYECGVRFLTDYLDGDVYFKVHRKDHNLDRCRNQFALLADMERKLIPCN
ncbi:MAG: aminoglycoside phosphotransferase family protein [Clostridia bacterium]|nr:aminoglycoside phosphotransferase family protein [Clostridia bacterium]